MNKIITAFLSSGMICACTGVTSCTVSEHDNISADSGQQQLESINAGVIPIMRFSYDTQNRIAEIRMEDQRVEFSYNPLQIKIYEYEERYNGEKDNYEFYLSDVTELYNIKLNAAGCIVSYDTRDTRYYQSYNNETEGYPDNKETDEFSSIVSYNSDGYITAIRNSDDDGNAFFNWNGDRLISFTSDNETYTYEYLDLSNPFKEWNPIIAGHNMIFVSGLFGPAPSWQIKSMTCQGDYETMIEEYAYRMLDNGQISQMKYCDEYDEVLTLTFKYHK